MSSLQEETASKVSPGPSEGTFTSHSHLGATLQRKALWRGTPTWEARDREDDPQPDGVPRMQSRRKILGSAGFKLLTSLYLRKFPDLGLLDAAQALKACH